MRNKRTTLLVLLGIALAVAELMVFQYRMVDCMTVPDAAPRLRMGMPLATDGCPAYAGHTPWSFPLGFVLAKFPNVALSLPADLLMVFAFVAVYLQKSLRRGRLKMVDRNSKREEDGTER